jgi:hypothetical protein
MPAKAGFAFDGVDDEHGESTTRRRSPSNWIELSYTAAADSSLGYSSWPESTATTTTDPPS